MVSVAKMKAIKDRPEGVSRTRRIRAGANKLLSQVQYNPETEKSTMVFFQVTRCRRESEHEKVVNALIIFDNRVMRQSGLKYFQKRANTNGR